MRCVVAVEFDDEAFFLAEEIDFHLAAFVEGNGKVPVELEFVFGGGEGLEALVEEFFAGASGSGFSFGSFGGRLCGV